jgi:hypothetical protein
MYTRDLLAYTLLKQNILHKCDGFNKYELIGVSWGKNHHKLIIQKSGYVSYNQYLLHLLKIISKWKYTADKIIMMPARKDLIKVQYRGSDNNSSALSQYYCTWTIWPKKTKHEWLFIEINGLVPVAGRGGVTITSKLTGTHICEFTIY